MVGKWSVCGRYVVGKWLVGGRYVVGMWSVCGRPTTFLWCSLFNITSPCYSLFEKQSSACVFHQRNPNASNKSTWPFDVSCVQNP